MKYAAIVVALLGLGGSSLILAEEDSLEKVNPPYPIGKDLHLKCEFKMQTSGVAVISSSVESVGVDGQSEKREVERTEIPQNTNIFYEADLAVNGRKADKPGKNIYSARIVRVRARMSYQSKYATTSEEVDSDSSDPASGVLGSYKEFKQMSFALTFGPKGKIENFDISGGGAEDIKKQLVEDFKRQKGVSPEFRRLALASRTPFVYQAMAATTAFLPPTAPKVGLKWKVHQPVVVPLFGYGFSMFTDGAGYYREESTLTIQSIEKTPRGRMVKIKVRGKRIPIGPGGKEITERVKFLEVVGEVQYNLDTGLVERQHGQSKPVWVTEEDRKHLNITFTETFQVSVAEKEGRDKQKKKQEHQDAE